MNAIRLPRVVEKIINRLEEAGYEAYAVGGCVRDSLLKRIPGDWDITTSARPDQVKRVFQRTIDTGIEHGTVTVLMGGEDTICTGIRGYEVTTYRIDGEYIDGRHPESVRFTPSLYEDLARRDFTINAMAYNPRTGIADAFHGMEDLQQGVIRAVGLPECRFREDALRMLRALRFSAQLGFGIEKETYRAICTLAPNLEKVSKERIAVELTKLLMSTHPDYIHMVFDTGLAPYICSEFEQIARYPEQDWHMPAGLPAKKYLCWGVLLRVMPSHAAKILRELKLDNDTIKRASVVAELFHKPLPEDSGSTRKLLSKVGYELYFDYLAARRLLEGEAAVQYAWKLGKQVQEAGDCISLHDMAVNGQMLLEAGVEKGPMIGKLLQSMFETVLECPAYNDQTYLMEHFVKIQERK